MAAESSPMPIYCSPSSLGRNHSRRSSARKSFISPSPCAESPRPLCPRDADTFSYKASHLPKWYMPQDLWDRLPRQLQSALAALQHSGAAVLTGYERLEHHSENRFTESSLSVIDDEVEVKLEDAVLPFPRSATKFPPMLRTDSTASSTNESIVWSPVFASSQSSASTSPEISASQSMSPISPICLTPVDAEPQTKSKRGCSLSKERSFSTPLEPHNHYYATELSQLRTESIPRLRHAARKVDQEWYDVKRQGTMSAEDATAFEPWWLDKKSVISDLSERCKQLSISNGIPSNGIGWCAP